MKVTHAAVFEPKAKERQKLVAGLKKAGLKVSGVSAPDGLGREQLVVLGPTLPRGAAVARAVRAAKPNVLVVAAQARGFKASYADAVLPLPVSPNDLKVRLPELIRVRSANEAKVSDRTASHLADGMLDPFTSFYTFTHFKEIVFVEVKRARRYGFPVAIALIALDPLNVDMDRHLHAQLMGGLALAIRRSLRDTDYPVQYGPDRVLLLMPHTDLQGALVVSRRICERVAKASLTHGDQVLRPTISAGVSAAAARAGEFSFGDLAARAQAALDTALSSGGNQVQFGSALDLAGDTEAPAASSGSAE